MSSIDSTKTMDKDRLPEFSDISLLNEWPNHQLFSLIIGVICWLYGTYLLANGVLWAQILATIPTVMILFFIPGYLILRILKIDELGSVRSVFYALLLSILFDFLVLGLSNTILWMLDVAFFKPQILIGVCGSGIMLLFMLGLKNNYTILPKIKISGVMTPSILVLLGLPLIAVISTFFINDSRESILQIFLVICIAVISSLIVLRARDKIIPFAIYSISLTLLLQTSLLGNYLVEWADVYFEFWIPNSTMISGNWDPSIGLITNAMLSLVVLPAAFSSISGLSLLWFFKIIFPFLIAFLPLGIFCIFKSQVDSKTSMIGVLFIVFSSYFYMSLLGLNRQSIATLFLAGSILILVDSGIKNRLRTPLLALFLVGIILSHYGLAFISLFALSGALAIFVFIKLFTRVGIHVTNESWLIKRPELFAASLGMATVFMLVWYSLVAKGLLIDELAAILRSVFDRVSTLLIDSSTLVTLSINGPLLNFDIRPYINPIFLLFTFLGLAVFVLNRRYRLVSLDYYVICIPFLVLYLMGYGIIEVSGFVEEGRFLFTTSMVLAVLAVTSIKSIERWSYHLLKTHDWKISNKVLAIFTSLILLSSSGVIVAISVEPSGSFMEPWVNSRPNFTYPEVRAEKWVVSHTGTYRYGNEGAYPIWADSYDAYLTVANQGTFLTLKGNGSGVVSVIGEGEWVFIGRMNLESNRLLVDDPRFPDRMYVNWLWMDQQEFSKTLTGYSMVYDNGYAQLYLNN